MFFWFVLLAVNPCGLLPLVYTSASCVEKSLIDGSNPELTVKFQFATPDSVLDNTYEILWNSEIQTDDQILIKRRDKYLVNEKKRTSELSRFDGP